jgi:transposase
LEPDELNGMLEDMSPHTIQLSTKEHAEIRAISGQRMHQARVITRRRSLQSSAKGAGKEAMAAPLAIGRSTVQRGRDRAREGGLDRALEDAPRPGQAPKRDDQAEAPLVALACSEPPEGNDHWTLELRPQRLRQEEHVTAMSTVTVWPSLRTRGLKPWRDKHVVHPTSDA